jgi:hypothetical protein
MEISGILWSKQSIGVAWHKLKEDDTIEVTVKGKDGKLLHPGKYKVNKKDLLERYGPLEVINKGGLVGIFIPRSDLMTWEAKIS